MMESNQNTPQARQQNNGPSQAVNNPDQPTIQNYVTTTLNVFGGIHLTWAVVYIVLGMVDKDQCFLGSIGGPIFLVIGSFSIATGLMKHRKLIFTMMIFSIICAMASGVMFIIASIVVHDWSMGRYCCHPDRVPMKVVVILIGTLVEGGISVASAVMCSNSKVTGYPYSKLVKLVNLYTRIPEPSVTPCNDVTRLEDGVGYNQVWRSPQQNLKPGVATPVEAGIEPPAYEAQPETN